MAKIYAPNKSFNGESASVIFVDGVGETDNPHLIQWFKEKGYTVEAKESKKEKPKEPADETKVEESKKEQKKK